MRFVVTFLCLKIEDFCVWGKDISFIYLMFTLWLEIPNMVGVRA